MTTTQDYIHTEYDTGASVKKLIWQAPQLQLHDFLLKNITSGDSAINENQAANNFLSS